MNLPSRDAHTADLAGRLAEDLYTANERCAEGWISPLGLAVRQETARQLAKALGFRGFLAALMDPHDDGRFDS